MHHASYRSMFLQAAVVFAVSIAGPSVPAQESPPAKDQSKDTIVLTVWAVTVSSPNEKTEDSKTLDGLKSLPVRFDSFDKVRHLIQRLKSAGLVRSIKELRLVCVDGQSSHVQAGSNQPTIVGTNRGREGRMNTIKYESIGTVIEAASRIDADKRLQVQLTYNRSNLEKSKEIVLDEPVDGKPSYADIVYTQQMKTNARMKSGTALLLQSDTTSFSVKDATPEETQLIILGAEVLAAGD
jgi:hypothetical protein